MAKFNKCPDCGANLDPGESCEECKKKARQEAEKEQKKDDPKSEESH